MTSLPFSDPAGASSAAILALASDRFESLPNGRPSNQEDLLSLLVLASQPDEEEDPNPRVIAAKIQMQKLGFGTRLKLSDVDQLGLYLLAQWRLQQTGCAPIERLIVSKHGLVPREVVRALWGRCGRLWGLLTTQRQELSDKCALLEAELRPLLPDGLALMEHQLQGVIAAREAGFRFIFADDMGLGKTIQVLACALLMGDRAFPMLVTSPLSMVYKWQIEASKWLAKLDPYVCTLNRKVKALDLLKQADGRPLVMSGSWQQPAYHQDILIQMNLGLVVGDESHYISNWDAARTRGFIRSRMKARAVLCSTGTLLENGRHKEAYSQLKAIDTNCLKHLILPNEKGDLPRGDRFPFLHRYCGPTTMFIGKKGRDGKPKPVTKFNGRSHEVEFGALLDRHMIRRTKMEVFGKEGLPSKSRFLIPVPISESQRMRLAKKRDEIVAKVQTKARQEEDRLVAHGVNEDAIKVAVKKVTQSEAVMLISALRIQIGLEKAKWSKVRIKELIEEGNRPIVFCWHNEVAKVAAAAYEALGLSVLLGTGASTGTDRDKIVAAAEAGTYDVVVLTSAYREGITLTAYNRVLMVERWWKPGQEQQAEDRVHRIGQTRDVGVEYLVIPGTYDDAIGELQLWKERGQIQSQGSAEERVYKWLMAA